MENETKKQIGDIAKEFLEKISLADAKFDVVETGENRFRVAIQSDAPSMYIGEQGVNLSNIQYVLGLVVRRTLPSVTPLFVEVDINNYKEAKASYLREMAREAANDVVVTKVPRMFPPMNSYERRIVHEELSLRGDVSTESAGQEPERRVVVKPKAKT